MIDALRPFVNESSSNVTDPGSRQSVDKYRNILTRVVDAIRIDVANENRMKQHWSDLAKKSTTVSQLNDNQLLRVLVEAGMKWLESGSANVDVLRTDPNHKALLFKVGSDVDIPDGDTLVRGNTFAQSRDVKSIAAELKSLLYFITRYKPSIIQTQLKEAHSIHLGKMNYHEKEEDAKSEAASSIVDTNIIFGIVIAVVRDPPPTTNGATTIDHFLASRMIVEKGDRVNLMNGGSVGECIITVTNKHFHSCHHLLILLFGFLVTIHSDELQ